MIRGPQIYPKIQSGVEHRGTCYPQSVHKSTRNWVIVVDKVWIKCVWLLAAGSW